MISEYKREKKRSKIIKTTTIIIGLSLEYSLMSECNTCIGEPNLEVLRIT